MPTHTTLRGSPQVGDSLLSDNLEANLYCYFNWGLLGAGGFFNVSVPSSGCYGGDQHRLRLVDDPGYSDGQVWEAFRKDWVWETGVERTQQPIRVSGVYVGGMFRPGSGVGPHKHKVDYPNGRVVFDSPIATSSVVTCEYSYRLFQFYTADAPWWKQLQTRSFRVDDTHFLQQGSGAWDVLAQSRVQLPAVVVEAVPECSSEGYQLGGGNTMHQDVLFHVFTEDRWHMKWMHDVLMRQRDKRLRGFDKNLLFSSDAYPLDADGSPKASGVMYPGMVSGVFDWSQIRFEHTRSVQQPPLGSVDYCTVRTTFGVDLPPG